MHKAAASILARTLRGDASAILDPLREALEALIGRAVRIDPIVSGRGDLARLFGGRELYIFPFVGHAGPAPAIFLAMDLPAAISVGAAYGLLRPAEAHRALASGIVSPALSEAIGEVASIIAGTLASVVRSHARSGEEIVLGGLGFRRRRVGPWPEIVAEVDGSVPWEARGFQLLLEGTGTGALLVAASDGRKGPVRLLPAPEELDTSEIPPEDDPPTAGGLSRKIRGAHGDEGAATVIVESIPPGTAVHLVGSPGDRSVAGLRAALEAEGCEVLGGRSPVLASARPASALFVVSRSPTDLRSRLLSMTSIRRPSLVVACSDRPTVDLVRTARDAGADSFIVLPADRARLRELFRRPVEVG